MEKTGTMMSSELLRQSIDQARIAEEPVEKNIFRVGVSETLAVHFFHYELTNQDDSGELIFFGFVEATDDSPPHIQEFIRTTPSDEIAVLRMREGDIDEGTVLEVPLTRIARKVVESYGFFPE